jgi:hypothetical protein
MNRVAFGQVLPPLRIRSIISIATILLSPTFFPIAPILAILLLVLVIPGTGRSPGRS